MSLPTITIPGLDPVECKNRSNDTPRPNKKDKRPFNLLGAPTLYPNETEFKDPYSYINSLYQLGEQYGILKIVPPPKWNPKFSIDIGKFNFECRKQTLNTMGAVTRSTMDWVKRMSHFNYLLGSLDQDGVRPMIKYPRVGNGVLNYYKLKEVVHRLGGHTKVDENYLWPLVAAKLELSTTADVVTASKIQESYHKYVLPYERYISYVKSAKLMKEKAEEKSEECSDATAYEEEWSRRKVKQSTPDQIPPPNEYLITPPSKGSFIDQIITTPVRSSDSRVLPPSPPPDQEISPSKRTRTRLNFANESNLKEEEEDLPLSKRRRPRKATSYINYTEGSSSNTQNTNERILRNYKTRSREEVALDESDSEEDKDEHEICPECDKNASLDSPLICKECEYNYHQTCIPPLIAINPKSPQWYCPNCLVGTGEFFFDEGEVYDLPRFQEMANNFKDKYLESELPIVDPNDIPVVECLIEQNFWQHVNDPSCTISVEYGADIRCDVKGSGFPTIIKDPFGKYSKDPWNLNNFPLNKMSLFRNLKTDISGVTVPWAYVGMLFSAFCWHSEDHYTYSINYQHFGDTKTWYGIPGSYADKFERMSQQLVPDLFEKQPDILFQRATMIPPDIVTKNGIPCYALDQHPGEFVITFPNAYHAGFNHGFNFNEAVNYAPPNWVEHGKAAVQSYKSQLRSPLFSHDELLIRTALNDHRRETAEWLYPHLIEVLNEETENQRKLKELSELSSYDIRESKKPLNSYDEDSYECCVCSCLCYVSRLIPTQDKSKVYCFDHFQTDKSFAFELEQSFTIQELRTICNDVKELLE